MARRTICIVVATPNLVRSFLRYHLIVGRLRQSSEAICTLVCPSAISCRTRCSVAVSVIFFSLFVFVISGACQSVTKVGVSGIKNTIPKDGIHYTKG